VQIQSAVLQAAKAQLQNAREQVSGRYHGLDANIASLKSQILEAEYNLAQTVIRAPSDGYVTQLARPGMTAVRLPFKPVLVFIPSKSARWWRYSARIRSCV
jgi:multidrug resistance efflux pump